MTAIKPKSELKRHRICVYLNDEEYAMIKEITDTHGGTVAGYVKYKLFK